MRIAILAIVGLLSFFGTHKTALADFGPVTWYVSTTTGNNPGPGYPYGFGVGSIMFSYVITASPGWLTAMPQGVGGSASVIRTAGYYSTENPPALRPFGGSNFATNDPATWMSGKPIGDYWVCVYDSVSYTPLDDCGGANAGFVFYWNGTSAQIPALPPTDLKTHIEITQPTQGTTTPTTTLNIAISYNIGTDLNTFSLNGTSPNKIGVSLYLLNTFGNTINLGTDFAISTTTGAHTYATSTVQVAGDYTLTAFLVGTYGENIPAPADCVPYPPFQTCTGITEQTANIATAFAPTFSLANGLFPSLGFQYGSTTSRAGLATTTCSITQLGGCFQNALAFLFFPSPGILSQFSYMWEAIKYKPPFGYVAQTLTALSTLNASSTPAFSFGNIPFKNEIFTPFKTALAGILWIGFLIAFYRGRLRHLDI